MSPGVKRGHEDLFDKGKETRPVDGAVEDPGRGQARHPQRGEKRTGLPPGARRVVVDAGPAEGPILDARYEKVRLDGVIQSQAVFIALGIKLGARSSIFSVCENPKMNRPAACTYLSGCTT